MLRCEKDAKLLQLREFWARTLSTRVTLKPSKEAPGDLKHFQGQAAAKQGFSGSQSTSVLPESHFMHVSPILDLTLQSLLKIRPKLYKASMVTWISKH